MSSNRVIDAALQDAIDTTKKLLQEGYAIHKDTSPLDCVVQMAILRELVKMNRKLDRLVHRVTTP